jgi:hypothetical protein
MARPAHTNDARHLSCDLVWLTCFFLKRWTGLAARHRWGAPDASLDRDEAAVMAAERGELTLCMRPQPSPSRRLLSSAFDGILSLLRTPGQRYR